MYACMQQTTTTMIQIPYIYVQDTINKSFIIIFSFSLNSNYNQPIKTTPMIAPMLAPIPNLLEPDLTSSSATPFGDFASGESATGAPTGASFATGASAVGASASVVGASSGGLGAFGIAFPFAGASASVGGGDGGGERVLLWLKPSMPGGTMTELTCKTERL